MARFGKETPLPPRAVLRLARDFFGPGSELGLRLTRDTMIELGFAGSGGTVEVSARPKASDPRLTDVTILSVEFDYWAELFLVALSKAERGPGPLTRLTRWVSGRFGR